MDLTAVCAIQDLLSQTRFRNHPTRAVLVSNNG
jgi:hypothetical protein